MKEELLSKIISHNDEQKENMLETDSYVHDIQKLSEGNLSKI